MSVNHDVHPAHRCYFIPPHVQTEVMKNAEGAAADKSQKTLSDAARKRRGAADTGPAETRGGPSLAPTPTGTGRREVYDSENTTNQRVTLVREEGSPETTDVDVINAYDNAGIVRAFFRKVLNRASIDQRRLDLVLNVHFGTAYNNAFWDGDEMTFGDGDGVIFSGFSRSLDVVAHELAHGVTQFSSGLIYKNESGRAQRALLRRLRHRHHPVGREGSPRSRPTGSSVTRSWALTCSARRCDPCATPARRTTTRSWGPTRNRRTTPTATPARATTAGCTSTPGIPNRAFYLAATEIGDTVLTSRIWYHALHFLAPNATFAQAAAQVAESARVLVKAGVVPKGATQVVRGAWSAVGV